MNIVFAGTPAFALPSLNALKESGHDLRAIYTQPDRPAKRGQKLQASPVKTWAVENHIPVYQPFNFKEAKDVETFQSINADVFVVIAYGIILPRIILESPQYGCINVHASLLPRWRGASPIQYSLLEGDNETGITIMQMDAGMDTGQILTQARYTIQAVETAASLHEVLSQLAPAPLLSVLTAIEQRKLTPEPQDNNKATYAPKIHKEDARINWEQSANEIDRKIRAFNPWPIAFTLINEQVLKIHKASIINEKSSQKPGTIIDINRNGIIVSTGQNAIQIEHLQFPGGKIITVASYLNANDKLLHVGKVFE